MRVRRAAAAATVALLLASCGSGSEDPAEADGAQAVAPPVEEMDDVVDEAEAAEPGDAEQADDEADDDGYRFFELGETAVVDSYDYDFEITVHDVTFTDTLPGELAEEPALRDNFFIAELTLRNTGDIRIPVQRLRPDLGLTDDLDATSNTTLPLDEESAVEELAPGEELTGRYWGDTRIHDSYYFGFSGTRGGMAQWIVPGQ